MTPLGWGWALFVWGCGPAWFLLNDRVKLLAYRFLDPADARRRRSTSPSPGCQYCDQQDRRWAGGPERAARAVVNRGR